MEVEPIKHRNQPRGRAEGSLDHEQKLLKLVSSIGLSGKTNPRLALHHAGSAQTTP
jgi:hypothetical protein